MRRTAFRRLQTNIPISWLLRDEFSDTRAAGSVNGTMPTPGPGTRTVTDTGSRASISSGSLQWSSSVTNYDPEINYNGIQRVAGRFTLFSVNFIAGRLRLGYNNVTPAVIGNQEGYFDSTTGGSTFSVSGVPVQVSSFASYVVCFFMRTNGCFCMVRGGVYDQFVLLWIDATGGSGTLYPFVAAIGSTNNQRLDFIRTPVDIWLPTPLISDGFGSSFGTSDGAGHAEAIGIGSGGSNVVWAQQVGTWTVSSSKAAAATLSGGIAIATVPLSTADVFAKVKVTRSAGSGGMVLRWTDANNYLYTEHDGTNAYLKQVLAGSTTTLVTAAATYSAGAEIVADLNGTAGRLYWNNAFVGSTSSISSSLTSTLHGLRSTDTGGIQLDDLCIYAKGTGGEYNMLNRYVNL